MKKEVQNQKIIMIVGGGIFQVPAVKEAKALGYRVLVIDMNPNAPAFEFADFKEIISTKDLAAALACAKKYNEEYGLAAVFTAGTDVAYTVSVIAESLGLCGVRSENVLKATNKYLMRKALQEGNVPHPAFAEARTEDEAVRLSEQIGFPIVMKPVDNMGARGVKKLCSADEVCDHFRESISFSGNYTEKAVIIEEYMNGPEISMDTLVDENGEVHLLTIADRHIVGEPFFVEIGHTIPSRLPKDVLDEAFGVMKKAIKAVGISMGAAKADIKITSEGAKIGEITARLSGGFHSQCTDPLATGMRSTRAALILALGMPLDKSLVTPVLSKTAIERAILPNGAGGVFSAVSGVEAAKKEENIFDVIITKNKGDKITALTSNIGKIGHIIASGDTLEIAEASVASARKYLKVEVE